jgi:peptide/nickel transport system substrate-binding protein
MHQPRRLSTANMLNVNVARPYRLSNPFAALLCALSLALLTLLAVASTASAKTLRVSLSDDATTLDPHVANLIINNRLLHNVYEGLVVFDADLKIAPALAVSWTQPHPKTWRFVLRPNVKFHDGTPFTADDVVFSVNRSLHPLSAMRYAVEGVASAKRVDALTVDLLMREVNPVLLSHLASFRIMSKAWATKHGSVTPQNYKDKEETFASRNANGTGPFKLRSRQPDIKTVLDVNTAWWGRAAAPTGATSAPLGNLTQVEWVPIKSPATRMAALLSGSIDLVLDPPVQDRDRIKNTAGFKLQLGSEPRVFFLGMDHRRDELLYANVGTQTSAASAKGKNPFKDTRVRRAVALAIDVDLLVKKVNRGYGRPTALIVGKEAQGYAAELDRRSAPDLPRAKALMAEAGYTNGFEVTMDCLNQTPFSEFCQGILPMLAQIGVRVKPNSVSFTNIFPKLEKFDTSFYIMGYGAATVDAFSVLQGLVKSVDEKRTGTSTSNFGRYQNPTLDVLIDKVSREPDMNVRNGLIREALTITRDDLALIPLIQIAHAWAMRANVDAPWVANSLPYFYRFSVK